MRIFLNCLTGLGRLPEHATLLQPRGTSIISTHSGPSALRSKGEDAY